MAFSSRSSWNRGFWLLLLAVKPSSLPSSPAGNAGRQGVQARQGAPAAGVTWPKVLTTPFRSVAGNGVQPGQKGPLEPDRHDDKNNDALIGSPAGRAPASTGRRDAARVEPRSSSRRGGGVLSSAAAGCASVVGRAVSGILVLLSGVVVGMNIVC
ncbi:uncharacterized protein A4U43_C04F6000 [Asparagus officinalis]|uniref:Uncharacterized protein n=1 Tax=Asparagus officinalis TaxID=4686 RepID=A0A5P1EYK1_ASPOF|nr:uncharacterized protein A4U43_C04F6000 [Asparagus officinalis]